MRFPSPLITDRLEIRTVRHDDAEKLNPAILETFDQLNLWMPWALEPPTMEESIATCARMERATAEGKDFALFAFDRQSGEFVLATGAHPRKPEVPSFEIGYWCRTSRQGKGYVTEAVQAVTRACLHEMFAQRLEIRCDSRNEASRRVAERCGYKLEGTFPNECRDNSGDLRTTLVFGLTPRR